MVISDLPTQSRKWSWFEVREAAGQKSAAFAKNRGSIFDGAEGTMISRSNTVAMVVGCAYFMQNLDGTVVTTALPQIAVSMKADPVHLTS